MIETKRTDRKHYFRTKFSEDIFNHKYRHQNAETWDKLADILVEDVCRDKMTLSEKSKLKEFITDMKFIPGGRYLYYAGRQFKAFNNCYLLKSEEDSREDWANLSWKAESCLMTGGGIGNDYSMYREKNSLINRTGGLASGPISKMRMINEIGREVMQGGSRRCLPEDALVFTKKGLIKIKDIKEGQEVYSENGLNKVLNIFKQGKQNISKIITNSGYFYGTKNHKMATIDNDGKIIWKTIETLVPNDILLHFNKNVLGISTRLPEDFTKIRPLHSTTCKDIIIPELDTEIAWLIGLIHGDGYIYNRKNTRYKQGKTHSGSSSIKIACHLDQTNIQDRAKRALEKFGVNVMLIRKKNENCILVNVNSQRLAEYFEKFIKEAKISLQIPEFILQSTEDIRGAYLAGLIDSDGAINNRPIKLNTTIYKSFAEQIHNLYSSLGICTRITTIKPKEINWKSKWDVCLIGFRKEYNLFIGKYSCKGEIPLTSTRKGFLVPINIVRSQLKYNKIRNNSNGKTDLNYDSFIKCGGNLNYIPIRVKSIENDIDFVETYDIEVENDHNFYCNGILTHNSAIYASLNHKHKDILEFIHCKDWSSMKVAGTDFTISSLKEKDFNFPAPLDMTNISVNYDTEWLEHYKKTKDFGSVFLDNVKQALKTSEPGFSFNFYEKEKETLRNACTEVTSEDDSDVCNLGSINLAEVINIDELRDLVDLSTKFLICGTLVADLPYEKVYKVREKNRRLGLGLMGIHEWLLKRGYSYSVVPELHEWLGVYKNLSNHISKKFTDSLGISKPVANRAIAPTGSIGILAGTTTGIEPLFAVAYKRRYLKGKDNWVYQYVIDGTAKILIEQFGVNPNNIESAIDLASDPEKRIKFQADIQDYVDMSISSTINLPEWGSELNNENTVVPFATILAKYAHRLRGFTCYADGSRGGQPLTPVSYDEAKSKEGQEFEETFHDICVIGGKGGHCGL